MGPGRKREIKRDRKRPVPLAAPELSTCVASGGFREKIVKAAWSRPQYITHQYILINPSRNQSFSWPVSPAFPDVCPPSLPELMSIFMPTPMPPASPFPRRRPPAIILSLRPFLNIRQHTTSHAKQRQNPIVYRLDLTFLNRRTCDRQRLRNPHCA